MDGVPAGGDLTRVDDGPVATVYSGHRAGVPVAIKVFPKRFDKRTMSAFTKEQARLSAVRRTTSILMVDGVEEMPSGESALRMEPCPRSLAGLVEQVGPLSAADVVNLGRAMATALAAAHSVGVVHGGVSPNNVLFREDNEPVLADFGVTLRQAFARDPLHAVEYLPPETLRTGVLNELTDLYGLGAVLHFALTARTPHPGRLGEQPGDRVLRILREPVPATNRQDVPVELSTLVARLLAATPDRRPQNARQVAEHLTAMLPNPPAPLPTTFWDDFDQQPPVPDPPPGSDDFAPAPAPAVRPAPSGTPVAMTAPGPAPHRPVVPGGDRDVGAARRTTVLAAPPGPPNRRLIRYELLAGAALLFALLALVPLLLLRTDPDEMSGTPRVPPADPADGVTVELAELTDLTDKVRLTWTATRDLDFAVVVAAEGESTRVLLANRDHAMTVDVDPDRKYCFLIQATDGDEVYESEPRPLRGAVCRK